MPAASYVFSGASGKSYTFARTDPNNLSQVALAHGVFIFGREEGIQIAPIYIGEAESIYNEIVNTMMWISAKAFHGADTILCHLLGDSASRKAERQDLIDKWRPPMT